MKNIYTIIVFCALFCSVLLLNNSKSKSFLQNREALTKKAKLKNVLERPQFIQEQPYWLR